MGAIWSSCRKVWKYNKYFKNSFAWLMGLTELIFGYKNFFGSGLFLTFFLIWWIEKMPQAKKVVNIKNQFLHARQPRERIFDIRSHRCGIFTITCQSFKWLPLLQFWELMSKNEILRNISCIYFMKIWVYSWFSTTEPSLNCKRSAEFRGHLECTYYLPTYCIYTGCISLYV